MPGSQLSVPSLLSGLWDPNLNVEQNFQNKTSWSLTETLAGTPVNPPRVRSLEAHLRLAEKSLASTCLYVHEGVGEPWYLVKCGWQQACTRATWERVPWHACPAGGGVHPHPGLTPADTDECLCFHGKNIGRAICVACTELQPISTPQTFSKLFLMKNFKKRFCPWHFATYLSLPSCMSLYL